MPAPTMLAIEAAPAPEPDTEISALAVVPYKTVTIAPKPKTVTLYTDTKSQSTQPTVATQTSLLNAVELAPATLTQVKFVENKALSSTTPLQLVSQSKKSLFNKSRVFSPSQTLRTIKSIKF